VLRDGKNAGELAKAEINHDAIVRLMVGRDLRGFYPRTDRKPRPGTPALEVRGVTFADAKTPISFTLRGGEIVGMAGLVGAGRTELAEALFGLRPLTGGEIRIDGKAVSIRHPSDAVAAGLLMAPEDRRLNGLVLEKGVGFNLTLPNLDMLTSGGLVSAARERSTSRELCDRMRVKTPSIYQAVGLLSGGNQQKVVLGKWMFTEPDVLILDEPTRGIDVGAKEEIYRLLNELAQQGKAIIMISSELPEILRMSHRIVVMSEGRVTGELGAAEATQESVMHLATLRPDENPEDAAELGLAAGRQS
jgi:ribose transport system ATP-binding protein